MNYWANIYTVLCVASWSRPHTTKSSYMLSDWITSKGYTNTHTYLIMRFIANGVLVHNRFIFVNVNLESLSSLFAFHKQHSSRFIQILWQALLVDFVSGPVVKICQLMILKECCLMIGAILWSNSGRLVLICYIMILLRDVTIRTLRNIFHKLPHWQAYVMHNKQNIF